MTVLILPVGRKLQSGPYLAILAVSVNILYLEYDDRILERTSGLIDQRKDRFRSVTLSR